MYLKLVAQCLLFTISIPLLDATAEVTAERILPTQGYLPEQTIIVEIKILGDSGEYTITETPPVGCTVSKIENKGKLANGAIQWTQTVKATSPLTLTYWLIVPDDATGLYEFSGTINGQSITGASTLQSHIPSPVGIFSDHVDLIGKGQTFGCVNYDPTTGEYELFSRDQIPFNWVNNASHIIYKQVWGDVTFTAKVHPTQLLPSNPDYASEASLGFYDSFTQGSKFIKEVSYAASNFQPTPTVEFVWRAQDNTVFNVDFIHNLPYPDRYYEIKLVRKNNECSAYYRYIENDEWKLHKTITIQFEDPVIVFFMARTLILKSSVLSEPLTWSRAFFSEVELIEGSVSVQDWGLY